MAAAIDRSEVHAAGLAFARDLAPSLALLAALLVVGGWAQVAIGLRPLEAVRRRLGEVRAGRAARLGVVRPLAAEVDHLLEAQELALERARARAADLAHGLKTPLTVLAADAEDLRSRGDTRVGDEIATVTDGIRRHVERELARARSGIQARAGAQVPVAPAVERVLPCCSGRPRGQRLAWHVAVAPELAAPMDAEDLAEILGNLAENAAKWAVSEVRFAARSECGMLILSVEDDGPGIPEGQTEKGRRRGGRLDEAESGSGLGLAIVGDLADAYGGSLLLGRSDLGGLAAEVRLPLASNAFDPGREPSGSPLAPGEHRPDQVFAMLEAREDDAGHVQGYQLERGVDEPLVQLLHQLGAPERVGGHQVAGHRDRDRHAEERERHEPAGRVVAEMARRPAADRLADVVEAFRRRPHEVAEARVAGADEAPDDAQPHEDGDGVA
jgi:signal transduction histidine kinase